MRGHRWRITGVALGMITALTLGSWFLEPQTIGSQSLAGEIVGHEEDPLAAFFPPETCTMDFRKAEVKNVLRALAAAYRVNILVMETVSGTVTASFQGVLVKDVFLTILKTAGLDYLIQGNIIWVDTFGELQKKQENAPLVTRLVEIEYSFAGDLDDLASKLKEMNSKREGAGISVVPRINTLIITDIEEYADRIVEMAKVLDKRSRQVAIMAKIAQISTDYTRELGVDWTGDWSTGRKGKDFVATEDGAGSFVVGANVTGGTGLLDVLIGKVGNDVLNITLSAMETEGKGKVLASPKVITQDNQEAKIQSGQEVPYKKETIAAEGRTVSYQFKDVTISLKVTPHIVGKDKVFMDLDIKQDAVGEQKEGMEALPVDTNTLTTKVLVVSGETVVIGGLISQTETGGETRVPLLADIPLLGWLFKSKSKEDDKTELFIFITPTILEEKLAEGKAK